MKEIIHLKFNKIWEDLDKEGHKKALKDLGSIVSRERRKYRNNCDYTVVLEFGENFYNFVEHIAVKVDDKIVKVKEAKKFMGVPCYYNESLSKDDIILYITSESPESDLGE